MVLSISTNSAYAEPKYEDFYRPIIKSLSINIPVSAQLKPDGGFTYQLYASVELIVRIHQNTLTGFRFSLANEKEIPSGTPCQSLNYVKIEVGNANYTGSEGNLKPLVGLISRANDNDWFLEKYKFEIPIQSNSFLKPCIGVYELKNIQLRDIASHHKSILINYGTPIPFYESLGRFDSDWRKLPLPENACPLTTLSEFASMPTACIENFDPNLLKREFTIQEIAAAEITEKNRLSELKAKQEADAKAAAELKAKQEADAKAAAELKAKQEAEAKAAANKRTTITCVKGKLTKKVTAVKPKCPAGYKVKK